jgi:hypothetical protein
MRAIRVAHPLARLAAFSATANTMLTGTSYFTAAEIEQTTRSWSCGGRSAKNGMPPPQFSQD